MGAFCGGVGSVAVKICESKVEEEETLADLLSVFTNNSLGLPFYVGSCKQEELFWVRPYYAENTTSRPICEVKQRQAQLVLR